MSSVINTSLTVVYFSKFANDESHMLESHHDCFSIETKIICQEWALQQTFHLKAINSRFLNKFGNEPLISKLLCGYTGWCPIYGHIAKSVNSNKIEQI